MNVCVIIPAAGQSRRFGLSDKLGQDLGGRPLLLRTVELFAKRDEVRSILVAGPPDTGDLHDAHVAFRERYAATLGFHGARVVDGGVADRWETVRSALAEVPDDATHIAVHDAVRPGAGKDLLDRVFEAAASFDAVVPAIPISATLKRVSEDASEVVAGDDDAVADLILGDEGRVVLSVREVQATVDRTNVVEAQTPQVFKADLLRRAYADADPTGTTDDAMVVERLGETVHMIDGERRNFKVTTPDDLALMRAVLGLKPPAERPIHKRF